MVAPTGILSLPVERLADLVASSTTFQTLTGTVSEATALDFVFRVAKELPPTGPFAVIFEGGFGVKSNFGSFASGSLELTFFDDITETEPDDAWFEFANSVGPIIGEIIDESRKGGRLLIREITDPEGSVRARRTEGDDKQYWMKKFLVTYGITAT